VPYIKLVAAEEAEGDLLDVYIAHEIDQGIIFPPYEVLTNNGPALKGLTLFQQAVRFGPSPLSRLQREMIATLTSGATGCVF
jgi:alkylhydroperoxidase family enzyme